MSNPHYSNVQATVDALNEISPTMCMAKWLQVSMHLPQGLTQSCYHPPTHTVPLDELAITPRALHNTREKVLQRKQMWEGERPKGCQYCWNIEDTGNLSDRHYRSSEDWVGYDGWNEVVNGGWDENINPRYVEVNFNQACNFKCIYCSPHLSTAWEQEITEHGPIALEGKRSHNDINSLRRSGLMPLEVSNKDNPYVKAFWDWWPELYPDLKVFRMTGGEPLMDKNTFKVIDYVIDNPNVDISISVTSNMCPPDQKLFEKFLDKLKVIEDVRVWEDPKKLNPITDNHWYVAPSCKHFSLFVSLDTVGEHAEYIREGLEYDRMLQNVKSVLSETTGTDVTFINTFNLLSIPKLKDFLQMILDLRVEFGKDNQRTVSISPIDDTGKHRGPFIREPRQRIWFDIPYLRYPDWMSAQNAAYYPELMKTLVECLEFMEDNRAKEDYDQTYHGFHEHEIAKLKRDIDWIRSVRNSVSPEEMELRKVFFYRFANQLDERRGRDFANTFPELADWWNDCAKANEEANGKGI